MVSATLNGVKIAETSSPVLVEGNQYFPPGDIEKKYFKPSSKDMHTVCPWKGRASYYDIHLDDGTVKENAAWYYPGPTKEKAKHFEGFIAFYKNIVTVS